MNKKKKKKMGCLALLPAFLSQQTFICSFPPAAAATKKSSITSYRT
jgi:hypothetical protein